MSRIIWSRAAVRDLEQIHDYIAADSARYAKQVVKGILKAIETAAEFPKAAAIVSEYEDERLSERYVAPYRIVYQIEVDRIEVVRIVHGAAIITTTVVE